MSPCIPFSPRHLTTPHRPWIIFKGTRALPFHTPLPDQTRPPHVPLDTHQTGPSHVPLDTHHDPHQPTTRQDHLLYPSIPTMTHINNKSADINIGNCKNPSEGN
ncbi:hypothetical protein Pmani_004840 [Petrolisthes manimaculis]|uniref:Uncharacterized protein n=1 Tax=Petrolisthes manimaculis TaxID=1843537 RepID=A0AAE1UH72_9EUCA|nr:hypothetical protein Pmani_004840 [Petrolisthes manimaculis]